MTSTSRAATCTFSINICVADVPYLQHIVPHLVRACNYPFSERMLVLDTAPMTGRYSAPGEYPTVDEAESALRPLLNQGLIDSILRVDYSPSVFKPIMRKHFGRAVRESHNFRNAPIYAYLYAYEMATADYFLHFDGDILLHQAAGHSWIREGIELLDRHDDILTATPLPGPPRADLSLRQPNATYQTDDRGFYAFKIFTARRFLFQRKRFERFLPIPIIEVPPKSLAQRLKRTIMGRRTMGRWEAMVSDKLKMTHYLRADLASPSAWTLHAPDHGPEFQRLLPSIIQRVEKGDFPEKQAGDYDLRLDLWEEGLT